MPDADALSSAVESLNRNEFARAERICAGILQDAPDHAKAWHLCGIANARRGNPEEAVECFENATRFNRENAVYHYSLGLAHKQLGQLHQAIESYREAIAKKTDFLEARNNLGNALVELGSNREALDCFRELVELFPQASHVHYNLANLLQDTGDSDEAVAHYHRELELDPGCDAARENLGRCLVDNGNIEEAKRVWINWLKHEPDNAMARHMLASISGENIPERCEDACIRETFNADFAKSFDSQLARIEYATPKLVSDALQPLGEQRINLDALDAGCGTGLCGKAIRSIARRLVGVDLSNDMLAEARKRELYDETVVCEITQYMQSQPQAFDLIISADTLCYFGELRQVLSAAHQCLRDKGVMIFTVESLLAEEEESHYRLEQQGRYRHTESYVIQTLRDVSFSVAGVTHGVLRKERGRQVDGLVVTATRGQADVSHACTVE